MNKNPYEIRLDVLSMAKDLATEEFYTKREHLMNNWEREANNAKLLGNPIPNVPDIPGYPSEEVIMQKAQFLSEYIDGNKTNVKTEIKYNPKELLKE